MTTRTVVAACIAIFVVSGTIGSDVRASCLDGDAPSRDDPENAVAMINAPKGGTAFLIDADNAIFLTSCHVVKWSLQLEGYFQNNRDKIFPLSKVACDESDIALLELKEDDSWQLDDRKQLRLSFDLPEPQEVTTLSTGHSRPTVVSRHSDSFDVSVGSQRMEILISGPVAKGDSGAPVISGTRGMVIAIVTHAARGGTLARAVPVQELGGFLGEYGAVPTELSARVLASMIQDSLSDQKGEAGIYWITGEPTGSGTTTVQFGLNRSGAVTASQYASLLRWTVSVAINRGRVDWSSGDGLFVIKHHEDFGGDINLTGVTDLEIDSDFVVESNTRISCDYATRPNAGILESVADVDAIVVEHLSNQVYLIADSIDHLIEGVLNSEDMIRDRKDKWEQTRRVVKLPFVRIVP